MDAGWTTLALYAAALLATGVAAGFIAGLLGVGGGIVIVPVLYLLLEALGTPEAVRMQVATGTSLSTIVCTSLASLSAHNRRGAVDWALLRNWAPGIVLGVLLGTAIAALAPAGALTGFFGVVALLVAIWMAMAPERLQLFSGLPRGLARAALTGAIGVVSALMGIGGGTLSVPAMTLCGYPIHRAVGTASAMGFLIGVPGTLGMIVGGWSREGLPPLSLGYVNLLGLALILPASMLLAPWGARAAHALPVRGLRIAFSIFLAATAARMLSSALG